ncbi:putative aspartic endopeptidase pep1 protein [Lasiodiplodia theobromae]|uniref:Aspartic protease SNP2 n=1 Tax=Lasiodiplodia theobromae TaxID=45133 RepID=A0A5N5DIH9_9PEZI|nr:Aspartic endopeptidase pep1 [Lasiodiplodia theobromae]KAB2577688.1 Aspartic protease SNP2 [Lasiodiplodia theobromae]KAF4535572.1 Aspartic endopeptidase pep1 [Lasiodiplodia theobromae]KAF9638859.1 putative aspartic endopeptidase pep1 protein [Lasiodiplodia theobromae]
MPSLRSVTALAALCSSTLASPVALESLQKRDFFSFTQVLRGTYRKNGPIQMAKVYNKYKGTAPSDVQSAAAAAVTGTVVATPEDDYDSLYLCPVTVGGTELQLDFDTGSADLWVFSTLMASNEQTGHAVYNPSKSGTEMQGSTWDISYGDGSGASGKVYADKVVVGGVTATSQAVEAATSVSTSFTQDVDSDGLLGLAFSSINTVEPQSQKTFFDTVGSSLAKKLFAVTLKKGEEGNENKYTGDIVYVDVDTSNGFWQFKPDGFAVGSGETQTAEIDAIADTGTTLLYLPTDVVSAYYEKVENAQYSSSYGGYIFPCSATLPDFSLIIGGAKRTVPGDYVNYTPAGSGTCFGGIQRDTGIGFSIIGDIFLKSQYVIHDATTTTPRLGWAQQPSSNSSSSNTSSGIF